MRRSITTFAIAAATAVVIVALAQAQTGSPGGGSPSASPPASPPASPQVAPPAGTGQDGTSGQGASTRATEPNPSEPGYRSKNPHETKNPTTKQDD